MQICISLCYLQKSINVGTSSIKKERIGGYLLFTLFCSCLLLNKKTVSAAHMKNYLPSPKRTEPMKLESLEIMRIPQMSRNTSNVRAPGGMCCSTFLNWKTAYKKEIFMKRLTQIWTLNKKTGAKVDKCVEEKFFTKNNDSSDSNIKRHTGTRDNLF